MTPQPRTPSTEADPRREVIANTLMDLRVDWVPDNVAGSTYQTAMRRLAGIIIRELDKTEVGVGPWRPEPLLDGDGLRRRRYTIWLVNDADDSLAVDEDYAAELVNSRAERAPRPPVRRPGSRGDATVNDKRLRAHICAACDGTVLAPDSHGPEDDLADIRKRDAAYNGEVGFGLTGKPLNNGDLNGRMQMAADRRMLLRILDAELKDLDAPVAEETPQ